MPRKLLRALEAVWTLRCRVREAAAEDARRSARIRALREPEGPAALVLARAWARMEDDPTLLVRLDALEAWFSALGPADLHPEPLVTSGELERAGIPRGPRWGELLAEAEERQLDGELTSAADAQAWLRAASGSGGGEGLP